MQTEKREKQIMLHQLDLYIRSADLSSLYSSLAVKLHGYIMSKIDTRYAGYLHGLDVNPFSLYLYDSGSEFIMRLSALNDEAAQILDKVEKTRSIVIYGLNSSLTVEYAKRANPISIADIGEAVKARGYQIRFVTPATYKTAGKYCNMPVLHKLFKPVINKINIYEHTGFNEESLEHLFSLVRIDAYRFDSASYRVGCTDIPSMTGYADISLHAEGDELALIRLLLGYAVYSGAGAKTSLGMGGFLLL